METAIPMPSYEYQQLVCGPTGTQYFEMVGRKIVTMLSQVGMLTSTTDLLDVGCGCGRVARYLTDTPLRSYVGFDRHPGMVQWCQEQIGTRDTRFTFQHFDLQSAYVHWDTHTGSISATEFTFPYEDGQFNAILLASVFTHMPPEEIRQYLQELQRVLRSGGKIVLSVFFSNREYYIDKDINFFYRPGEFMGLVETAGFVGRLMTVDAGGFAPMQSPTEAPKTGYEHNWYLLCKRRMTLSVFLRTLVSGNVWR